MQRWTDVISKVPGKDARFYHLIMLLWLAEGQIACLSSLNHFSPSPFALSYVPLFQINASIRFKCASLCQGSFLPARIHRRVKAMHRIKNLSCNAFIQHLLLLFSVSRLLPSTQRQQSFPRMPCTCPLAFISLINMKAGTTCPSVPVENQNNWWLFDWPWPCP